MKPVRINCTQADNDYVEISVEEDAAWIEMVAPSGLIRLDLAGLTALANAADEASFVLRGGSTDADEEAPGAPDAGPDLDIETKGAGVVINVFGDVHL